MQLCRDLAPQPDAVFCVVIDDGHPLRTQGIDQEAGVHARLNCVAGVDAEEVAIAALADGCLGRSRRDDDDWQIFVGFHGRQRLATVVVANDAQHLFAAGHCRGHLIGHRHCDVGVRLVVQRHDLDFVAQQPTALVQFGRGKLGAAQHGLPTVGLKPGQRRGNVNGHLAFGRTTLATCQYKYDQQQADQPFAHGSKVSVKRKT